MTKRLFHYVGPPKIKELHYGEGNGHPHRRLTPTIYTDIREVVE